MAELPEDRKRQIREEEEARAPSGSRISRGVRREFYPVIVGTDADAKKEADLLASNRGGKVTTSEDYGGVADKMIDAVKNAMKDDPAPSQGLSREGLIQLLIGLGAGAFLLGIVAYCVSVGFRRRYARFQAK